MVFTIHDSEILMHRMPPHPMDQWHSKGRVKFQDDENRSLTFFSASDVEVFVELWISLGNDDIDDESNKDYRIDDGDCTKPLVLQSKKYRATNRVATVQC